MFICTSFRDTAVTLSGSMRSGGSVIDANLMPQQLRCVLVWLPFAPAQVTDICPNGVSTDILAEADTSVRWSSPSCHHTAVGRCVAADDRRATHYEVVQ